MSTIKKECAVIMLPTKKASVKGQLVRGVEGKTDVIGLVVREDIEPNESVTFNNLYVLSDDEIKEGDWFINLGSGGHPNVGIYKANSENSKAINEFKFPEIKKVIATTDKFLNCRSECNKSLTQKCICPNKIPQLSEEFVRTYIEAYNKSEKIESLLVDYDTEILGIEGVLPKLKVNQKDKTISISILEKNFKFFDLFEK